MRYELVISQHGVRIATKVLEGDEIHIDLKKGEVRFWRPSIEQDLYCIRYGCPMGTAGILIKFPCDHYDALSPEEAILLAKLIAMYTSCDIQLLPELSATCQRYVFIKRSNERARLNVKLKDVIEINLKNGSVDLYKAGALYQVGSQMIKIEPLGSFYSFMHDEVAGVIELISALTDTNLDFLEEKKGVLRYVCVNKEVYKETSQEKEIPHATQSFQTRHEHRDLTSLTPGINRIFAA